MCRATGRLALACAAAIIILLLIILLLIILLLLLLAVSSHPHSQVRHPPGDEIYRNGNVCFFEVSEPLSTTKLNEVYTAQCMAMVSTLPRVHASVVTGSDLLKDACLTT
jgi:hypothetical protein